MSYLIEDELHFGKHKGRTIKDIYAGNFQSNSSIIKDFINRTLEIMFHKDEIEGSVTIENFEFGYQYSFDKFYNNYYPFEIIVTNNHIIIDSTHENEIFLSTFFEIVKSYFIASPKRTFQNRLVKNNGRTEIPVEFKNFLISFGEPSYILWAIKNINDFIMDPDELNDLIHSAYLDFNGIEMKKLSENVYEYRPIVSKNIYEFPESIILRNEAKYKNYVNRVDYDFDDRYADEIDDNRQLF